MTETLGPDHPVTKHVSHTACLLIATRGHDEAVRLAKTEG